jgi:2-polyprenyl-3-methyl-5-hydroxy-6-metoxy-1,4-benzoquinol methylase
MDNEIFLRQIKNQKQHWWFQARKKIIEKIIFRINFKKKINILDYGSGSGVNIDMLSKYGRVDVHEKNKFARLNIKKNKRIKKIYSTLKIKKNFYHLILLADVIEHINNPKNLLKILKSFLKKNGYILFTVPSYQFLFSSKDKVLGHYRRYDKNNFQKTIDEFELIEMSHFNTFLFLPIAALILLNKIIKKNFIKNAETTPNYILNKLLYLIFSAESYFLKYFNFPIGLSIYALVKKC